MDHDRVLRQVLQETVHLFNYELLSDDERQHLLYFFFQAEDGIRDIGVTGSSDVCSSDLLEPIFEADFDPCSYGFRPMRRAQDAIEEIRHFSHRSYEWILEGDIASCFDEISHPAL